jgi:predicted  nucleic acid-binding Zn-ribbon protein
MKKQLEARLEALKAEFESGKNVLADLDKKSREVETTLMRISGAIQVIEELLEHEEAGADSGVPGA